MTTKNLPRQLTRDEVADRIYNHLQRMERDPKVNKLDPEYKTRDYYGASAGRHGAKIGVTYVSYQGKSMLTFEEALSYLRGLDGGFRGRHFEWLRAHPLPKREAEVRYRAIVRTNYGYALYDVTRITGTRVYGKPVSRDELSKGGADSMRVGYPGDFVEKSRIVKRQATVADFKALLDLEEQRDAAHERLDGKYNAAVNRLLGKQEPEDEGEEDEE